MPNSSALDQWIRDQQSGTRDSWDSVLSAYKRANVGGGGLGPLSQMDKNSAELTQNQEGASFGGKALKTGLSALGVVGRVIDIPRSLVVATGTGIWNSAIAPALNTLTDGPDWQTDVNDDKKVTSDDNIVGQWSRALNPFDDRDVIGMGRLAPFLQTQKDDSVLERGAKYLGAFALDSATDPLLALGPASRALGTTKKAALAGENALELGGRLLKEVPKETAIKFVEKQFSKRTTVELIDIAKKYGMIGEEGIDTLGKSADEIAGSIARNLDDAAFSSEFSRALAQESGAAVRRNNYSGLRRSLQEHFGEDAGNTMFNQFMPEVRGALEAGIPGTKFRMVASGNTGGGQIIEKFGPVGNVIENAMMYKQKFADSAIAKITFGSNREWNKDARSAAVRAFGEVASTADQNNFERYFVTQAESRLASATASGALKEMVDNGQVLATDRAQKAAKLGAEKEFEAAKKDLWNLPPEEFNKIDVPALSEVEQLAHESVRAQRNIEAKYIEYKATYGDMFSPAGVVEGQRRIITDQGLEFENAVQNGFKSKATSSFKGRQAFEGMSVEQVNKEMGFKFFEDNPDVVHRLYVDRMQKALQQAATLKVFRDSGLHLVRNEADGAVSSVAQRLANNVEGAADKATSRADDLRVSRIDTAADLSRNGLRTSVTEAERAAIVDRQTRWAALTGGQAEERIAAEENLLVAKKKLESLEASTEEFYAAEKEYRDQLTQIHQEFKGTVKEAKARAKQERRESLKAEKAVLNVRRKQLDQALAEQEKALGSYEADYQTKAAARNKARGAARRGTVSNEEADKLAKQAKDALLKKKAAEATHAGRVQAAKDRVSESQLKHELLLDPEHVTAAEAHAKQMDDYLADLNAMIAEVGTPGERRAARAAENAADRAKFKETGTDPLSKLKADQTSARQEFRTTPSEADATREAAQSSWEARKRAVDMSAELKDARKAAVDEAMPAWRGKATKERNRLLKAIEDSSIDQDLKDVVKAQDDDLADQFDILQLLGKDLAKSSKNMVAIMETIASLPSRGRADALEALQREIRDAADAAVSGAEKLVDSSVARAETDRLTLSWKDKELADKLRGDIHLRTENIGIEDAATDEQVVKWQAQVDEIEKRADTELTQRAAEEKTTDYADRVAAQITEELNTPSMKRAAKIVTDSRKNLDKAEAIRTRAFELQASNDFRNALLEQAQLDGELKKIGNVTHRGKEIPVPEYLRDVMVPSILAEGFAMQYRITTNPVAAYPAMFQAMQALEQLWKTSATIMRGPSFVTRNVLGGTYNAVLGGTSREDFALGMRYSAALRRAHIAAEEAAFGAESRKLLTPDNLDSFLEDFIKKELDFDAVHGVKMYDLHKQMQARNIFGGSLTAELQGANPLKVNAASYRKNYRDLSGGMDQSYMNRGEKILYGGGNKVVNSRYTQFMGRQQESAETFLRASQYIAGVRRGGGTEASHLYGEMLVKATQFDYSDMSNFERRVLRHIFPFFTFTKNNLPLQLRSFVNRPGIPLAVMRMNYYANQYFGGDDATSQTINDNMAPWLKEAEGHASMFDFGSGNIVMGIGVPLIDVNKFLPDGNDLTSWKGIRSLPMKTLGGFGEESISQVNPLLKLGLESATGTNVFTGIKYSDHPVSPLMERVLSPWSKGIDPETGKQEYSGFAEQQVKNLLPPLAQMMRLFPWGPLEDSRSQQRIATTWAGSGLGLSGLPVAPLATATENQVTGWQAGNIKDASADNTSIYAEAGLDWGDISTSKNNRTWADIAAGIEHGLYLAPYVEQLVAEGKPVPSDVLAKMQAVVERMKQS